MAAEQDGEQQVVSLRLVFPQRKKKKVKLRARQFPISCVQKYKKCETKSWQLFYQRIWISEGLVSCSWAL